MCLYSYPALAVAAIILTACSPCLGQSQKDVILSDGPVQARFTFRPEGELVILPVTYKGKEYPFCLDTGCNHSMFDLSLLLGEPYETQTMQGPFGANDIRMYARPKAAIGPIPLTGYPRIGGLNMQNIRKAAGLELMGIVGCDALAGRVVRIDFDQGQVVFLDSVESDAGQPFPVMIEEGKPFIMVRVNGNEHRFTIDTGNSGFGTGDLITPVFEELSKKGQISDLDEVYTETFAGTRSSRIGRVKELILGEFKIASPFFSESNHNLLGIGFWSRFVVTFDFRNKNRQVYLKPGKRYNVPDVFDLSGMTVLLEGGKVTVHSVSTGSASDKAGVREGDQVWMLGTQRAIDVGLMPMRRKLCAAGSTVPMVLRREGKEFAVSLALPAKRSDAKK